MYKMETKNESLELINEETKANAEIVLNKVNKIEKHINTAIDDAVDSIETGVTTTEVQTALINVLKSLNNKELTQIILSMNK